MKSMIFKLIRSLLLRTFGREGLENIILTISNIFYIDLLLLAYKKIGIFKYWNDEVSGEKFVVTQVLSKYIQDENTVIFDVGANIGNYARILREEFPNAKIYAFEPNPNAFEHLSQECVRLGIFCSNLGLSSQESTQKIYTYSQATASEHASVYKNVLLDLHHANELLEIDFSTITLDTFCTQNKVEHIHFLKIDTEGHEFDVLIGAERMLSEDRIDIIQFEFNEMNIISRVFLKDFYRILGSYRIYRLDSNRLISIFKYDSINEIFKFQNLLAIHKKFEEYSKP